MPNHVYNSLTAIGDEATIQKVVELVDSVPELGDKEGRNFDFNRIIPQPKCILQGAIGIEEEASHPNRNWYAWNNKHWNTKWNAYDCDYEGYGHWVFNTAWDCPEPVIRELSWLFPELTFELHCAEESGSFDGEIQFIAGERIGEFNTPAKYHADEEE